MRCSPGWKQACNNPNTETGECSERKDPEVRRDFLDSWDARQERLQRINPPDRQQQSGEAAEDSEQRTFGDQLVYDVPASSTERGADANLAIPRERTRQQQIRDVDARDQKNTSGHCAQHEQRGVRAADHRIDLRNDFSADMKFCVRVLAAPLRSNGIDFRLRLLDRLAWF